MGRISHSQGMYQQQGNARMIASGADLAPLYETLCQELGWTPDATQLKRMQTANQEKLQQLKAVTKDADENLGETEVKEALTAEADYLNRIGKPLPAVLLFYQTACYTCFTCYTCCVSGAVGYQHPCMMQAQACSICVPVIEVLLSCIGTIQTLQAV